MAGFDIGVSLADSSAASAGSGAFNVTGGGGNIGGSGNRVPWYVWALGAAIVGAGIFAVYKIFR